MPIEKKRKVRETPVSRMLDLVESLFSHNHSFHHAQKKIESVLSQHRFDAGLVQRVLAMQDPNLAISALCAPALNAEQWTAIACLCEKADFYHGNARQRIPLASFFSIPELDGRCRALYFALEHDLLNRSSITENQIHALVSPILFGEHVQRGADLQQKLLKLIQRHGRGNVPELF